MYVGYRYQEIDAIYMYIFNISMRGMSGNMGGVRMKCHNFHILLIANKLLSLRKICKQT